MRKLTVAVLLTALTANAEAASTISTNNSFAYGANIGWMDWRGFASTGTADFSYVPAWLGGTTINRRLAS